jgi:hypothetical protein
LRLTDPDIWDKLKSMDIKQIEAAILELPAKDLSELMAWFQDHCAQVWDRQIEEDLEAGRLDHLLAEVDKEYEAGLAQPL